MVNLLDLIIFLKDGTQHIMTISRLKKCGIAENIFFIESYKEGRIEIPLDSIDGFKIERPRGRSIALEGDSSVFYTAIGILSKHLT